MSLSRSSSILTTSSGGRVLEEFDTADREVMFYLHTRPIDHAVLGYAEHTPMQHWALVAVFKDESVRTMEGIESEGILTPNYFKECPSDSRNGKYLKLIAMISSPHKLREVVIRNCLNRTAYSATNNNCQNWVKAAADAISSNLAIALANYKTNGELNIFERVGQCCWTSSRSSSDCVVSILKKLAEPLWSDPTNLEEHKLD